MKPQAYNDLEVYSLSKDLAVRVHHMSITELPKFELYEEASQVRRSSKAIAANIVEGFARRRYKNDFLLLLTYAIASCDETKAHLELLVETGSLNRSRFSELHESYRELGAKLYNFRAAVESNHQTRKTMG